MSRHSCNFFFKLINRRYSNEALNKLDFVPKHPPLVENDVELLSTFIESSAKILVLTGAGISTESGIPDYRSEGVGLYARSNHKPIQYQEFIKSASVRQRYWARNFIGWPKFSQAQPNVNHLSITHLQKRLQVEVVTQNVDGLHSKAGTRNVTELHGTAFTVICLSCKASFDRHDIQKQLLELNPDLGDSSQTVRPDGDVDIDPAKVHVFKPPLCQHCGGILKPDIVFFGDNVPRARVDRVRESVTSSDSLLVLGSSLTVFSAYRIILQAVEEGKRIAVINIGPTRADDLVDLKIVAKCGDILPKVC